MRKQFVECKSRQTAQKRCPWAGRIIKVVGGYQCFEGDDDYKIWKRQK